MLSPNREREKEYTFFIKIERLPPTFDKQTPRIIWGPPQNQIITQPKRTTVPPRLLPSYIKKKAGNFYNFLIRRAARKA